MSRVGAVTRSSASPARSGRPPRETIAVMSACARQRRRGPRRRRCSRRTDPPATRRAPTGPGPIRPPHRAAGRAARCRNLPSILGLRVGQQVEQQRSETFAMQPVGDAHVPRRAPARTAAVGEHHDGDRLPGDRQIAGQGYPVGLDGHGSRTGTHDVVGRQRKARGPARLSGPALPGDSGGHRRRHMAATAEIRFESRSLRSASRSISRTRSPESPSTLPVSRRDSGCPFSRP